MMMHPLSAAAMSSAVRETISFLMGITPPGDLRQARGEERDAPRLRLSPTQGETDQL
jgi:hypothetical protein